MTQRPVIAVIRPYVSESGRQHELLRDLPPGHPRIQHPQRLVMHVGIQIPLVLQQRDNVAIAPGRPVVRSESNIDLPLVQPNGLGQIRRPLLGVTNLRTPQRDDVVHRVRRVLGHADGTQLGEQEVHLGRRFRTRRHLELHHDTVDGLALPGGGDMDGWLQQTNGPSGDVLPEPATDLPGGPLAELGAVHVNGAAGHGGPRVYVLRDGVLHEPFRGQNGNAARPIRQHTPAAAVMVDMRVRVDEPRDLLVGHVVAVQLQRGGGRLGGDEGVDDDDSGVALDNRHVREIEPTDLIDLVGHLVQPLLARELRLPPETGVRGLGRGLLQEAVGIVVPHDGAGRVLHDAWFQRRDESLVSGIEVSRVRRTGSPTRAQRGSGLRIQSNSRRSRTGSRGDETSSVHGSHAAEDRRGGRLRSTVLSRFGAAPNGGLRRQ